RFLVPIRTSYAPQIVLGPWSSVIGSSAETRNRKPTTKDQQLLLSSHFRQRAAQLLRRPEQRVLCCLFCRIQHFADGPQLQSLVMLQFKNHAFPRSQLLQCLSDLAAKFA